MNDKTSEAGLLYCVHAAERVQRVWLHPGLQVPRTILSIGAQGAPYIFELIRPVLWNEHKLAPGQTIEQVWFAGVHSNVGGGYPKDQMALVALNWMMTKARQQGVVFVDEMWEGYRREADVHSKLYDSRAGLGAYYRYLPRDVKKICLEHGIAQAKIHG